MNETITPPITGPRAPPIICAENKLPNPIPLDEGGVNSTKIELADGKIPENPNPHKNCIRPKRTKEFGTPCRLISRPALMKARAMVL